MIPSETLEDLFKRKYNDVPEVITREIGHYNLFRLEPIPKGTVRPLPYRRRDFYKVMRVVGNIDFHYADRGVSVQKQALVFSNPQIPYKCEHLDRIKGGCYCILSKQFYNSIQGLD